MKSLFTAVFACCALVALGVAAEAASLTSSKKLEVKVDPAKVDAEKKALWEPLRRLVRHRRLASRHQVVRGEQRG